MDKWKDIFINKISKIKHNKVSGIITAAFLVFAVSFFTIFCIKAHRRDAEIRISMKMSDTEIQYTQAGNDIFELNEKLWLLDVMYFRNVDSAGKFRGNEYYKKSVFDALKRLGMMDENGNLLKEAFDIPGYEYSIVVNGKNVFSSENAAAGIPENRCSYTSFSENEGLWIHVFGQESCDIPDRHFSDRRWYSNGEGMEYYYYNPERTEFIAGRKGHGIAVYDYDTSGLKSYTDELGAEIFVSSDGKSPVPDEYGGDALNVYQYNDENTGTVYVYPPEEDCKAYADESLTPEYSVPRSIADYLSYPVFMVFISSALFILAARGYDTEKRKFYCDSRIFPNELYITAGVVSLLPLGYLYYASFCPLKFSRCILNAGKASICAAVFLFSLSELILRIKCRIFKESFFMYMNPVLAEVNEKFRRKSNNISRRILIKSGLLLAAFAICLIEVSFDEYYAEMMLLAAGLVALFFISIISDLMAINKLGKYIEEVSTGSYSEKIIKKTSPIYYLTEKLNGISYNINSAVENQVRSERMKVDLVTNVSHDIKTPLTSIVSYVDLLSKDESLSPEARSYVQILEQKTDRLKNIVSDLFDLAKATSGTDIESEEIDAVILINQVLADMEDKINRYGKVIKTEIYTDEAHFIADGKKMYRTLQNVIDNALKYSLEGTRIFLTVSEENSRVLIRLKNTSAYEMNFSSEEITERFVRGDSSRTTEGSGLGLSIAKSFTEACGGDFTVEIDGDVFCINMSFPLTFGRAPASCESGIANGEIVLSKEY